MILIIMVDLSFGIWKSDFLWGVFLYVLYFSPQPKTSFLLLFWTHSLS